jgi:hypothetical protein
MQKRSIARFKSGFTFVELCLGLVITSLVLGAVAAFSLATAKTWQQGSWQQDSGDIHSAQSVASVQLIGTIASARLENELRSADATGGYYAGNLTSSSGSQAGLLLWKNVSDSIVTKPTIEGSELEILLFDAANHRLMVYTPKSAGQGPAAPASYSDFSNASWIDNNLSCFDGKPLAQNIDGMQIYVHTPTDVNQHPLVEYRLYFSRQGQNQTRYGAVNLRAPTTPTWN